MFSASKTAGASSVVNYIEDVFSTWLYTGNGTTQTITNGVDLSNKGGLVWAKDRDNANGQTLYDTSRGVSKTLASNSSAAQVTEATNEGVYAFGTNGFSIGGGSNTSNGSGNAEASWTFREQAKFFDIVTYTGTGSNRTIAHALGSVPGCIMIKRTNAVGDWQVYHRSLANTQYMVLNTTAAAATGTTRWNSTTPTSTVFSVGTDATVNASGGTYVAYIFAHNAGGFGLTGTDNVIACGSYVGDGTTTQLINLGFEPQWLLVKIYSLTDHWFLVDNMRAFASGTSVLAAFRANTADAELTSSWIASPTPVGFTTGSSVRDLGDTYLYIAIRRGPMKVPSTASSVFGISARSGTGANATVTGGQIADAALVKNRGSAVASLFASRITGTGFLATSSTSASTAAGVTELQANPWDVMDGVKVGTTSTITNASANTYINYLFKRAPSFMDVVCYTGTDAVRTVNHNLQAVPELIIHKSRSQAGTSWATYCAYLSSPNNRLILLQDTSAEVTITNCFQTPTTTTWGFASGGAASGALNANTYTYVAYLFATCAGVSKVGSYTGNGTTQTIDCGLTAGARFVLLKRTDAAGNWYVYDTARGMTTLTDPYWLANSSAAEAATLGSVTTVATGFALNSTILAAINVNAASYIFLAIA